MFRPNVTTPLGLFAGPTQFGIWERSLLGFLRKNDLMAKGFLDIEECRLMIEEETDIEIYIDHWGICVSEEED